MYRNSHARLGTLLFRESMSFFFMDDGDWQGMDHRRDPKFGKYLALKDHAAQPFWLKRCPLYTGRLFSFHNKCIWYEICGCMEYGLLVLVAAFESRP